MSSNNRKGIKYGKWSEADMAKALEAYRGNKYGLNEICRMYSVPKATFKRHLDSKNKVANQESKIFGRTTVFSPEFEQRLAKHILNLEKIFYGVTIKDVRNAAYELAEQNNIKHNFNKIKKQAGKKWFYAFMRRHPQLSLRQPESTSIARCKGFNKENVTQFFELLEKIVDECQLNATKIFNVDESGFSTVAKKCQKILALKGKRQVGSVASGERGVNTTMVVCASAAGRFVAPMIIFKRKRANPDLRVGAPPDCLVEISDTGYINKELFVTWLKSFINAVKPTRTNKVLLVLDGHSTHSKNLEAIELARNNGVIILQLPGHTTHRLQPLDVAVFKPLELYYTEANEKWLRSNPGLTVSQYQVAQLLGEAYARAAVVANAMNGFKKTGIWPVDRNVFSDADFAPSELLIPKSSVDMAEHNNTGSSSDSSDEDVPLSRYSIVPIATKEINLLDQSASTSKSRSATEQITTASTEVDSSTTKEEYLIDQVLKSPIVDHKKMKPTGIIQKAQIITSTPYKDDLEAKQTPSDISKKKTVKRKVKFDFGTSKKKSINDKEWYCKLCCESIVEDMIQCLKCRDWVHESCANIESRDKFLCDICS